MIILSDIVLRCIFYLQSNHVCTDSRVGLNVNPDFLEISCVLTAGVLENGYLRQLLRKVTKLVWRKTGSKICNVFFDSLRFLYLHC